MDAVERQLANQGLLEMSRQIELLDRRAAHAPRRDRPVAARTRARAGPAARPVRRSRHAPARRRGRARGHAARDGARQPGSGVPGRLQPAEGRQVRRGGRGAAGFPGAQSASTNSRRTRSTGSARRITCAATFRRRSPPSRGCFATIPGTRKAPDALLKAGYCQIELKRRPRAGDARPRRAGVPGLPGRRRGAGAPRAHRRARRLRKAHVRRNVGRPGSGETPHHGDIPLAAGRGGCRRLADVLHPPDRLPAALPLLRHRLRVPWRRMAHRGAARGRGARIARAPRLRHGRRAARTASVHDAAHGPVRAGLRGVARDERRHRRERAWTRASRASSTSRRRAPARRSATSISPCTACARTTSSSS